MGQDQSSSRERNTTQAGGSNSVKICYYELLGVDRQANEDEIKKAYRKKALELHPDRNYGNVENSTMQFAEIQSAYEVLSDPQERAWYDSHRDAILKNCDIPQDSFIHNIRGTTSSDIITLIGTLTKSVPLTDASNGFYGSLRSTFFSLAKEEEAACEWNGVEVIKYPDFGGANDSYEEVVRPFYTAWMGFATKKTFSWMETYKYSEAPDRRIRRLMEKENRRLREDAVKEFNDTVRSLVAFIRKRDPRFIPSTHSEADRQGLLREAAAAQAARSRAANRAKFSESVLPEWIMNKEFDEEIFTDSDPSEVEHYECVICSKFFKSEKQYEMHEKSKKHIKAVRQLNKHMRKEDEALRSDSTYTIEDDAIVSSESEHGLLKVHFEASFQALDYPAAVHTSVVDTESIDKSISNYHRLEEITQDLDLKVSNGNKHEDTWGDISDDANQDDDECNIEHAPRKEVESQISKLVTTDKLHWTTYALGITPNMEYVQPNTSSVLSDNGNDEAIKSIGKAKARRAKKALRREPISSNDCLPIQCTTCKQAFPSKSQLFSHIRDQGHARSMG